MGVILINLRREDNNIKVCEMVYSVCVSIHLWDCGNQALLWMNMAEIFNCPAFI
jgi:hypothetical protein